MAYTDIDDPTQNFNTVLWTGNASTQSITGVGFQPDWIWYKARSRVASHGLFDSIRGTTKQLYSDNTNAEATYSGVTSFDSDGFSLGSDAGGNDSSETYVAWNWLAGGTASSNTDGAITSSVSANTTAGFSIVSYTGTDVAGDTVGHGLGAVPKWILVKRLVGSGYDWVVYHANDTAGLYLNSTGVNNDSSANSIWFNGTAPTSSVFSIGTDGRIGDATSYIAYCFAEKKGYSKFGSYTGNGSTDGTYIHLGFKPAWVMLRRTDTTQDWYMLDNKRDTINPMDIYLRANENGAEPSAFTFFDFLSNGFKCRNSTSAVNASGGTYIYMAFAESPFTNSNGVPNNAR